VSSKIFGNTARRVATVGQGSWKSEAAEAQAIAALKCGLDLGLTHIDTAEMYGGGDAERLIAKAIAGRRAEVFLVSKVLPSNASRRKTISACEASLARLKTDYLDCYLLHWPGSHPLEGTIEAFEALKRDGKIRAWGVSNFDVADLEAARAVTGEAPACNQVLYHLQERAIEHAVLPWCREHGTAVVAYTPFGESSKIFNHEVLRRIAGRRGATARQVALAFLLRHPESFVIPKAASLAHVEDNAGALRLALTDEDIRAIDAAFPRGKPKRSLPTI
jgi:diketogulonate reductase-like aldo/keto reductase